MHGGSALTIKENTEALVAVSKETGPKVNADKTNYMVMSRDQNSGRSYGTTVHNSFFARVVELKYLGTTLANQNSIQEEIKSRLKSGNACCHSVQNLLSYSLLTKNKKIKVHRNIILRVLCMGVKIGPFH
jgi:hypothetical protein